jgi:primase-polymerase (primpol)-like protein
MTRPTPLPVLADNIPDVLKQQPRWMTWHYLWSQREGRAGRWVKLPSARTNDASTWLTFDAALDRHTDGIGFCLGDGWAGLDLDHLTSGPIVDRIPCYRERSPGGHGIKAIGRSHRIGGEINFGANPPAFTTWHGPRFFAITGHGSGDPTIDLTELLDEWFPARTFTTRAALPSYIRVGDVRGTEAIERLTDEQVVDRILATPQADKFSRLVRGDIAEYGGDRSRADQALCTILAYWCQGDLEQVDRMFRQSALMRDKWNAASYRRATLAKAVRS